MPAAKKAPPKPVVRVAKNNKSHIALDPESKSSKNIAKKTDANLTPKQRQRADLFILEYMRDHNATQAFIRTKFLECPADEVDLNYASNQGYQMTRWPYVACKIREALENAEEKNIVKRSEVLHGLKREALFQGVGASHGARVQGWGKLATILGMEQKQVEKNLAGRGGVMIMPEIEDVNTWESKAQAMQAALKEDVRT